MSTTQTPTLEVTDQTLGLLGEIVARQVARLAKEAGPEPDLVAITVQAINLVADKVSADTGVSVDTVKRLAFDGFFV